MHCFIKGDLPFGPIWTDSIRSKSQTVKYFLKKKSFMKLLSQGHISLDSQPNDAIHIWLEISCNIYYVYSNNIQ